MFARVLTLHVRLEKRPELTGKILKEVIPVVKRANGPIDILVLQDEIELDKILVVSLWETREDAHRYHAAAYGKVKSILEPYLTFPPDLRMYNVDESVPWHRLTPQSDAALLGREDRQALKIMNSR